MEDLRTCNWKLQDPTPPLGCSALTVARPEQPLKALALSTAPSTFHPFAMVIKSLTTSIVFRRYGPPPGLDEQRLKVPRRRRARSGRGAKP